MTAVSELDIYRSAHALIRSPGQDASLHAAMMADRMLEKGDLDGRATWLRILKAIDTLRATAPAAGDGIH